MSKPVAVPRARLRAPEEALLNAVALSKLLRADGVAPAVPTGKDPRWAWLATTLRQRKGQAATVALSPATAEGSCWLVVAVQDQPFLTDSINLAVRRLGHEVLAQWHPVVLVSREQGVLQSAKPAGGKDTTGLEAWVVLELPAPPAPAAVSLLQAVREVVALTQAAVRDFGAMRSLLQRQLPQVQDAEERALLDWLLADHMIWLGYRHYDFKPQKTGKTTLAVQATAGSGLGILASTASTVASATPLTNLPTSLSLYVRHAGQLILSKTTDESPVHRAGLMDYVALLERNTKGEVVGEHRWLGLLTSRAYTEAVTTIPLVRSKLQAVQAASRWPARSSNARSLRNVMETWPRDELFLADSATLTRHMHAAVALREQPAVRALVRTSAWEQAATVLVYLPLHRMSTQVREQIGGLLSQRCGGPVREFRVELTSTGSATAGQAGPRGELARLMFRVSWQGAPLDEGAVTEAIVDLVRGWDDDVCDLLVQRYGALVGRQIAGQLSSRAGSAYRAATPPELALADWDCGLSENLDLVHLAVRGSGAAARLHVRLRRRGQPWLLTNLLPLVESCGLQAEHEESWELATPAGVVWVHDVVCAYPAGGVNDAQLAALQAVLLACLTGTLERDSLNRLALGAALSPTAIAVWRAWVAYAQQADRRDDPRTVRHLVRARPALAAQLWHYFELQHDLQQPSRGRTQQSADLLAAMEAALVAMPLADEERVWRLLLAVVQATLRTNVFQPQRVQEHGALAFKLDSAKIPTAQEAQPWREIWVYHPQFEAIHLRGGPVARGGLRHSDRASDFRTEVLGLMTAQMRKNTIIVPVGAKGGFYVRPATASGVTGVVGDAAAHVKACYQKFITALLSVTDTYGSDGRTVPPRGVRCHDAPDPYLVVAADKGTAKLSDTANAVAQGADFWEGVRGGFWLGDAFASGGSQGYDHKAMGITARGAWISVLHHAAGLGILPSAKRPLVLAGIGDMGGDVFGNGLLLDTHVQLVAAFNHAHIFLDPNPDPAKSLAERQRLFAAGLGWDGYHTKLLSAGGGVWRRSEKVIPLSDAMQAKLGVKAKQLAPEALIQAILAAPVDVLWNGGIGTYIKADDEPHSAIADKSNDSLRVDASRVRAKIIGEGGNLGVSAKGRVALAKRGVRLNTDALDNSAGVGTSDHEVTLKILLDLPLRAGKLTPAKRNDVVRSMTAEVATLVLADNAAQNIVLSATAGESADYHAELVTWQATLVQAGCADELLDALPTAREVSARADGKLVRPELCALLAGTKRWLREQLDGDPELLQASVLQPLLGAYFPPSAAQQFGAYVPKHPLAKGIIATVLCNRLVHRYGLLAVPRLMTDFEAPARDAVRALVVAETLLQTDQLWAAVGAAGLPQQAHLHAQQRLQVVTSVVAAWVLRHGQPVATEPWLEKLAAPCAEVQRLLPGVLQKMQPTRPELAQWVQEWAEQGVPQTLAQRLALLSPMVVVPDVAEMARALKRPPSAVLLTHLTVAAELRLPALVRKMRSMQLADSWSRQAVQAMGQELMLRQRRLTEMLLKRDQTVPSWLELCGPSCQRYHTLVQEILRAKTLTVPMLSVLLGRLRELEA